MLFKIRATQTVQLRPADFHNKYKEAVKIVLCDEIQDKLDPKYGKVIWIQVDDEGIMDNPLLLTHQGLALFKVEFEALVERVVPNEICFGLLKSITQQEDFFDLNFQVGCSQIVSQVDSSIYEKDATGNKLVVRQDEVGEIKPGQLTTLEVNQFYRLTLYGADQAGVLDIVRREEDEDSQIEENESNHANQDDDQNGGGSDDIE